MIDLLAEAQARVEPALAAVLDRLSNARPEDGPAEGHGVPARLDAALRYALLSPGKRLRPALVLGGAHALGAALDDVLPAACAVEMIHAYSLVHDDLPSMDDDDERRGLPSTHKKFDEATALLAGDALLTEALGLVADGDPLGAGKAVPVAARCAATVELARSAGAAGMVGGQQADLELDAAGRVDATRAQLIGVHRRKTGRLIQASAALGGLYGSGDAASVAALRRFGAEVGLAFQLVDDALDGDGVARLEGIEAAREAGRVHTEAARDALAPFGDAGAPLWALAERMVARSQ